MTQAESAEDTFKKIEKTILEAKTLRISFDYGRPGCHAAIGECGARRGGKWGSLVLKAGNKVYFEEWACSGRDREVQEFVISDGVKMVNRALLHTPEGTTKSNRPIAIPERTGPKDLDENLRIAFARSGQFGVHVLLGELVAAADATVTDARKAFTPSEWTHGAEEKGLKTLTYKLTVERMSGKVKFEERRTIWYDPKTLRIAQHRKGEVGPDAGTEREIVYLDVFEKFDVNPEIDDSRFCTDPKK